MELLSLQVENNQTGYFLKSKILQFCKGSIVPFSRLTSADHWGAGPSRCVEQELTSCYLCPWLHSETSVLTVKVTDNKGHAVSKNLAQFNSLHCEGSMDSCLWSALGWSFGKRLLILTSCIFLSYFFMGFVHFVTWDRSFRCVVVFEAVHNWRWNS